jgi:DNA polymerase I-like protein with 3'-5' exonuclease and polymerase domains
MSNVQYVTQDSELTAVLEYLEKKHTLALDTETNTLDPRDGDLLLVQIGDKFNQFVLDVFLLGNSINKVFDLIIGRKITLIAHNAKFDYLMIKGHLGIELDRWVDTMIAEQLLNQGKTKVKFALDALLEKYMNIVVNKSLQTSFIDHKFGATFSNDQILYAAKDIEYLIPLDDKLHVILKSRDMENLADLEYRTITATGDLEYNGIYINKEKWIALRDEAEKEANEWKIRLDTHFKEFARPDLFGELGINYNSPKQIAPLLEKICKMKIKSTADAALSLYSSRFPVINDLLEYRKATKKVTTYGAKFLRDYVNNKTGRIHSTFQQLGADSGRYASKNPNMNNIPRAQVYRTPFQAQHEDWRIISADFSQQELRILAHLSEEPKFLDALKKNLDLHCFSASLIYDIPYQDFIDPDTGAPWKKDKKRPFKAEVAEHALKMIGLRNYTKAINFGIIYGIGANKLANELGITKNEASHLLNKYFKEFPKIKELIDKLASFAEKNKYAVSPLDKRRRDLSDFDWDNPKHAGHAMNIAKNLPFQGCGASTTKLSLVKIRSQIKLRGLRAKIINVIHDEILVEVHKDDAEQMAEIVRVKMIEAFEHYAPLAPMEVEAVIDNHWVH